MPIDDDSAHDAVLAELIAAACEVKYKTQRLKDAIAAAENVPKRASFSDKPDGWVRYKDNGMSTFFEGTAMPDPKVYGSGWLALYRRTGNAYE